MDRFWERWLESSKQARVRELAEHLSELWRRACVETDPRVVDDDRLRKAVEARGIKPGAMYCGKYRIVKQLGSGGQGEVWLAKWKYRSQDPASDVALKFVLSEEGPPREGNARNIVHPNVRAVHWVEEDGELNAIIMQWVVGESLVNSAAGKTIVEIRDIVRDLTHGVHATHAGNVIHNDLKPANVLLKHGKIALIDDFGLSVCVTSDGERVVAPGGTKAFAAPEVLKTKRSDIYSLGLILDWMLDIEETSLIERSGRFGAWSLTRFLHCRNLRRLARHMTAPESERPDTTRLLRLLQPWWRRQLKLAAFFASLFLGAIFWTVAAQESWSARFLHEGHQGGVRQSAFSPGGAHLLTVGEDGHAIRWRFEDALLEREHDLSRHGKALSVAVSPDGKMSATGHEDRSVIVWRGLLESELQRFQGNAQITSVAFSPDARRLGALSNDDGVSFELATGEKTPTHAGSQWGPVHFSPDGKYIITARGEYCVAAGAGCADRDWFLGTVSRDSSDGRYRAAIDSEGVVRFADLHTRTIIERAEHQDNGRAVAFFRGGSGLATGAEKIILWSVPALAKIASLDHKSPVWSLMTRPQSEHLVSTHGNGSILAWDLAAREVAFGFSGHAGAIQALDFSDEHLLASGSADGTVALWTIPDGRRKLLLRAPRRRAVRGVAVSKRHVAAVSFQDQLTVWNIDTGTIAWSRSVSPDSNRYDASSVSISPDGRWVATTAAVFDLEKNGEPIVDLASLYGMEFGCLTHSGVAFSNDSKRLFVVAACEAQRGLVVLDTADWRILGSIAKKYLTTVALSLDDARIAIAGAEGIVEVYSSFPLALKFRSAERRSRIKALAFIDGGRLVSGSDDHQVRLWDDDGDLTGTIGTHSAPITAVAASRDGRWIAVGDSGGGLALYEHRTLFSRLGD